MDALITLGQIALVLVVVGLAVGFASWVAQAPSPKPKL
jgi:hypothetical protein